MLLYFTLVSVNYSVVIKLNSGYLYIILAYLSKLFPSLKYCKLFQLLTVRMIHRPSLFNAFNSSIKSTFILDLLDVAHFLRLHFEDGKY